MCVSYDEGLGSGLVLGSELEFKVQVLSDFARPLLLVGTKKSRKRTLNADKRRAATSLKSGQKQYY